MASTLTTGDDVKSSNSQPDPTDRRISTLAVHAGELRQKPGDAITDPIFCASTYTFRDTQSVIDFIEQEQPREEYGRYGNPGERVAERKLAALEGAEDAVVFSSGMAALVGLLMAKLNSGDEVIFFDECYHRSREFCSKHMSRFGVKTVQVPACDYKAMEAAVTPNTKMLISESPTNPHLSVVDLDRFAEIGRRTGVETLIDATLATPYNLRPIDAGVDYVFAFGHEIPGWPQRFACRLRGWIKGRLGAGQKPARHHGRGKRAAKYLFAAAGAQDI